MGRATRRGKSYAGFAAAGAGLMGLANFIDKEQQRKAQALREQRLMQLKQQELDMTRDRMKVLDKDRADAKDQAALNTFLDKDLPSWRAKFIGTDEDAELRAAAWEKALEYGIPESPEEMKAIQDSIAAAFGEGRSGQPILTESQLEAGMAALRTRADLRGVSEETLTPDRLRSLITQGFTVEQGGDVGVETSADPAAPGVDYEAPGLMDTPPAAEPQHRYEGASQAIFGESNPGALENISSNMFDPWFDRGSSLMDMYNKHVAQPTGQAIDWLGNQFGADVEQ